MTHLIRTVAAAVFDLIRPFIDPREDFVCGSCGFPVLFCSAACEAAAGDAAEPEPPCATCHDPAAGNLLTSARGEPCCYDCAKLCRLCGAEPMAPTDHACVDCRAKEPA